MRGTLIVPGNAAKIKTSKLPALVELIQNVGEIDNTYFKNECTV